MMRIDYIDSHFGRKVILKKKYTHTHIDQRKEWMDEQVSQEAMQVLIQ